jgi:hypothetical protein
MDTAKFVDSMLVDAVKAAQEEMRLPFENRLGGFREGLQKLCIFHGVTIEYDETGILTILDSYDQKQSVNLL